MSKYVLGGVRDSQILGRFSFSREVFLKLLLDYGLTEAYALSDAPTESMQRPFYDHKCICENRIREIFSLNAEIAILSHNLFFHSCSLFHGPSSSMARPRATPRIDAIIKTATRIASNDLFPEMV